MPDFKPFGGHNYGGYEYASDTVISWTVWLLATYGSFYIDPIEAGGILAGALYLQEHPEIWMDEDDETFMGNGASAVHNVQAGYCMYHTFFKGRREPMIWVPAHAELFADIYCTYAEDTKANPPILYAHDAHYMGMFLGMAAAFVLDWVRPHKKGGPTAIWQKWLPFLAGFTMYKVQSNKEEARKAQLPSHQSVS